MGTTRRRVTCEAISEPGSALGSARGSPSRRRLGYREHKGRRAARRERRSASRQASSRARRRRTPWRRGASWRTGVGPGPGDANGRQHARASAPRRPVLASAKSGLVVSPVALGRIIRPAPDQARCTAVLARRARAGSREPGDAPEQTRRDRRRCPCRAASRSVPRRATWAGGSSARRTTGMPARLVTALGPPSSKKKASVCCFSSRARVMAAPDERGTVCSWCQHVEYPAAMALIRGSPRCPSRLLRSSGRRSCSFKPIKTQPQGAAGSRTRVPGRARRHAGGDRHRTAASAAPADGQLVVKLHADRPFSGCSASCRAALPHPHMRFAAPRGQRRDRRPHTLLQCREAVPVTVTGGSGTGTWFNHAYGLASTSTRSRVPTSAAGRAANRTAALPRPLAATRAG